MSMQNDDALFGSGVSNWTLPTDHVGNNILGNNGNLAVGSSDQVLESSSEPTPACRGDSNNLALRMYKSDIDEGQTERSRSFPERYLDETTEVKCINDSDGDDTSISGIDTSNGEIVDYYMTNVHSLQNRPVPKRFVHPNSQRMDQGYLCNATIPTVSPSDRTAIQHQPSVLDFGQRSPAARAKTTHHKNKQVKQKSKVKGADGGAGRGVRPGSNGLVAAGAFQPELRIKKYDEDTVVASHEDTRQNDTEPPQLQTLAKLHRRNNKISPKQDENGNNSSNKRHTGKRLNVDSRSEEFGLPIGLDPYVNPRNLKRNNRRVVEPHPAVDASNSEEFHSVSHVTNVLHLDDTGDREGRELPGETTDNIETMCVGDNASETSVKVLKPGNHLEYRNNLWHKSNADIAPNPQKNVNMERQQRQVGQNIQPVYDFNNQPLRIHNNLQTLQSDVNVPAVMRDCEIASPELPRVTTATVSADDGGLPRPSVFQGNQQPDTNVQQVCSQQHDTDVIASISRPEQTQDTSLYRRSNDSYSDVPTAMLFGEGDSDFLMARELQARFDQENHDNIYQGQLDCVPNDIYLRNIDKNTQDDCTLAQNYFMEDHLSTGSLEADAENYVISDTVLPLPSVNNQERITYNPNRDRFVQGQIRNDEQYQVINPVNEGPGDLSDPQDGSTQRVVQPHLQLSDLERPAEFCHAPVVVSEESQAQDDYEVSARGDETYARLLQSQLNIDVQLEDERLARQLQAVDRRPRRAGRNRTATFEPLHTRYNCEPTWTSRLAPMAANVSDSRVLGVTSTDRPLQRRRDRYLIDPVNEYRGNGYDIPPNHPPPGNTFDYVLDDYGPEDEHLVSMTRDPHMLASLLMQRAPNMMIPNHVDLNDYEALWELAERLGEVRRVGMEREELARLPVHTYQCGVGGAETVDCRVCLAEFTTGEQLRTLPCCHTYHMHCIDEWLTRNAICPVCRQSVKLTNSDA